MKIDALFISDVHLGSKGSNAKDLLHLLKKYEPKQLFIVGDFIDGWLLKKHHYWNQDFTNIIRKILSYSKNGTEVCYVVGNHDEFLRDFDLPIKFGDNINIVDEVIFSSERGNTKYLITHGDHYDGIIKLRWLAHFGSWGYELAIGLDRLLKSFGYKSSVSKYLKNNVKSAVKFITDFEHQLKNEAIKRDCIGVICGHIHTPEDRYVGNVHYLNCGDWIENNSYIIYNKGEFKLKYL